MKPETLSDKIRYGKVIHKEDVREFIKKLKEGCGRRFRAERPQKPTFTEPDYFVSIIVCGNNLSDMVCPQCEERNERIDSLAGPELAGSSARGNHSPTEINGGSTPRRPLRNSSGEEFKPKALPGGNQPTGGVE